MRHFLIGAGFFAVLCAVVLRVPAAEPEWAGRMNRAENWTKNASGELNIVQENGAVRFEAFFAEAGDLWFYPVFALRQFDSAAGCTELSFEVKADCPGGIRHAFVIAGGRYLAYPVPGPEWRRVSVKLDPADAATLRTFSVGLNPENPGKTTLRVRGFRLVADGGPVDPSLLPPLPVVMAVKSKPVSGVFYDTEPVRFEFGGSIAGNLRYRVADWTGETVSAGAWPENGGRLLTLPELPRGYYTLALESDSRKFGEPMSFAVVADASTRKPNPESFFAVDTAQSWLSGAKKWNERFPGEQYEAVSELCRRAGFSVVRDRFGWKHVEPERGVFDPGVYERNAALLEERGIRICTIFDMAPAWTRPTDDFPNDLAAVYESSKRLAGQYRGRIFAWEFFNEPDNAFHGPAWLLAAGTKAFSLGVKAADPALRVLNSSFCVSPLQHFAHTALKSGIGEYIDAFNYHVYSSLSDYPWTISRLRSEMAKHGLGHMPVWLTENGTNVDGNAACRSYRPGTMVHSFRQELQVAEFVPKSQLLMQSLGVERDFFFVMTPYWENEGKKDWGLLRMDLTVKPAYVAFAALNAELGNARLLGTLEPAENVCGYLYAQPDGTQTLAFWSKSGIDGREFDGKERKFRLKQPDGSYRLSGIFGTPSRVRSENGSLELTATRYPAYLGGLSGLSATVPVPAAAAPERPDQYDLSIVLKPVPGEEFKVARSGAYADLTAIPGKLTLEVYNFSAEPKSGFVTMRGGRAAGLPEKLTVGPFSKVEIPLEVTPEIPAGGCQVDLAFSGRFGGREITPAVVPLIQTGAMLAENVGREPEWRSPARWRANSSGEMEISFDEKEQALKLKTVFAPGTDRWIYPEYLLDLPGESLAGAVGITFEIKAGPEVRHGIAYTALMAVLDTVQEHGKAFWMRFPAVSDKWEKRIVIFGGFDPAGVRMLRIGMNPKCDDFTYYIRNVRVVYGK